MRGIGAIALLVALLLLGLASTATADSPLGMRSLFSGRNIYSPAVIDADAPSVNPFAPFLNAFGRYAMWYGGWQSDSDQPNDKIYRRVSQDNSVWSDPVTVVTPARLPGGTHVHVNDPSVTVTNRPRPYTMFFTACRDPCGIGQGAEIWSAESFDGIAWNGFKRLSARWSHPAEPSAVWEPSGRQVWKLYYTDRSECDQVRVVSVDAQREAFDVRTVYRAPPLTCALNPEVKYFNGTWHLFYNAVAFGAGFSIEEAESGSNTHWSTHAPVIQNNGPLYCATVAPGVLPAGGDEYDLYFGLTPRQPDGTCRVDDERSIERWRLRG